MWKRTPELESSVLRHILRERLLSGGETVLCAVSGGADSTALALLLHALRDELRIQVEIVHVDHGIPEALSAAAADAARALAHALDVPFHLHAYDVPAEAKRRKLSLEAAGHEVRRALFEDLCKRSPSHRVATAHSLEDQAETVLLRLTRGTGLRGLRGIRTRTPHPLGVGDGLIRPLLSCARADLRAYVSKHAISLVEDPTNTDTTFMRNRVRHELLPLLQQRFNPRIAHGLSSLATRAQEDESCLEALSRAACTRYLQHHGDAVSVDRDLLDQHPALRRRAWQQAARLVGGNPARLTGARIARMDAMLKALPGRVMEVEAGLSLEARRGHLLLSRKPILDREAATSAPPAPCRLDTRGQWQAFGEAFWVRATLCTASGEPSLRAPHPAQASGFDFQPTWSAWIDLGSLQEPGCLRLRSRLHGDRWVPPRRRQPRKLKEALQRWGIPSLFREHIPILVHDDGCQEVVVAVCGWGVSSSYLAHPGTTSRLFLEVSGGPCGESLATLASPESYERAQRHCRDHLH